MRRQALRQRLVLAAWTAVAIALAVVSIVFYLIIAQRLDRDADGILRSRVQAALATVSVSNGRVRISDSPRDALLDQSVWVFDSGQAIDRPAAPAPVQRAVAALVSTGHAGRRDADADVRLLAEPVRQGGRTVGFVVASISLAPYEQTARLTLVALLVLDAVTLVVFGFVARALVRRALRPVAWMTAQANDWSEHDLDRRFALGPPRDELTALAATLDGLLGRLGGSLRHEQRFSAEMAHELRTPLATARGEAELALASSDPTEMHEALQNVLGHTDRLAQVIETLLAAAQREADPHRGTADALQVLEAAAEAGSAAARDRGVDIVVVPAGRVEVDVDSELAAQILSPVVENACRHARKRVSLTYAHDDEAVVVRVVDDGPGVADGEREAIFAPGARGETADDSKGAGLGPALARRLARGAGGDVTAESSTTGGRFAIRLPAS